MNVEFLLKPKVREQLKRLDIQGVEASLAGPMIVTNSGVRVPLGDVIPLHELQDDYERVEALDGLGIV